MTRLRVLLVDDSTLARNMLKRSLAAAKIPNLQIIEAQSAAQALEEMQHTELDLIMCDWNMPEMTGVEFVRQVRSQGNEVKIVMVTSVKTADKIDEALRDAGANAYLTKPFSDADVIKVLGMLL